MKREHRMAPEEIGWVVYRLGFHRLTVYAPMKSGCNAQDGTNEAGTGQKPLNKHAALKRHLR